MKGYRRLKARFKLFTQSFWAPISLILLLIAAAVVIQRQFQKKEIRNTERAGGRPVRIVQIPMALFYLEEMTLTTWLFPNKPFPWW